MKTLRVISLILLLITVGCSQANRDQGQEGNKIKTTAIGNRNEVDQKAADRLVEIAMQDPNVVDATAIVIGDYAIVGIDLPAHLDEAGTGSIKYSVAQSIKKDPLGKNAIVTADADVLQRLKEMAKAIQEGHPIRGIADELAEIVNRLVPQFPREVQNEVDNQKRQPNKAKLISTE